MINSIKPTIFFINFLILIILQGCNENNSSTTYPTTMGDGVSITTTEEGAVMAPNINIIKSISQEVSHILKNNITEFNTKIAIDFNKETNYCDISGLKKSQNSGNLKNIIKTKSYQSCKEEESLENGKININYTQMDTEGKYPKNLYLTVEENYSFNDIKLKKDLTIESSIIYSTDQNIKEITLKINGRLTLDTIDYGLLNITQTITY